ncbi:hypothetical protein HCH52_02905 [Oscillospiraceae bacterium HV4-5-C5C]|nr:PC4/YdbC family ssDNA-binding protein [Oscillospiraceae bacterium]MDD4368131.1 PC4/YdbC family ssDNA-binding protein [Oscillospiraceae bacterium]NJP40005.1 hypothetical protein [Oscillospiraceae bacterium HV4-5-C5C]
MAKQEFTFEIVKHIGVLSTNKSNWNRELNVVRWNNGRPKFDVRDWSPEHDKMGKGISFTGEELAVLKELLDETDPYEYDE